MRLNKNFESDDNICDLLLKVIEFTRRRHVLLSENVANIHVNGFQPLDFPVEEFSNLINDAIAEQICNKILVLRDSELVKFGEDGDFEIKSIVDEKALSLFNNNISAYLELQAKKISENSINHRLARDLLKERQMIETPLLV